MNNIKVFTIEEFNNIERDEKGIKHCPTGNYSQIREFGDWCDFERECVFGDSAFFGKYCKFGYYCRFGEKCVFEDSNCFDNCCEFQDGCKFGNYGYFGWHCSFYDKCIFGNKSVFLNNCIFDDKCKFGKSCQFGLGCWFGRDCECEFGKFDWLYIIGGGPGMKDMDVYYYWIMQDGRIMVQGNDFTNCRIEEFNKKLRKEKNFENVATLRQNKMVIELAKMKEE